MPDRPTLNSELHVKTVRTFNHRVLICHISATNSVTSPIRSLSAATEWTPASSTNPSGLTGLFSNPPGR